MIIKNVDDKINFIIEKLDSSDDTRDMLYWVFVGTNLMYTLPGFGAGGYAHIVTDDWNLDCLNFCIELCDKNEEKLPDNHVALCRKILIASRFLNEIERSYAFGFDAYYFRPEDCEEDFSYYHRRRYDY